jgi:hypothetical protein
MNSFLRAPRAKILVRALPLERRIRRLPYYARADAGRTLVGRALW